MTNPPGIGTLAAETARRWFANEQLMMHLLGDEKKEELGTVEALTRYLYQASTDTSITATDIIKQLGSNDSDSATRAAIEWFVQESEKRRKI